MDFHHTNVRDNVPQDSAPDPIHQAFDDFIMRNRISNIDDCDRNNTTNSFIDLYHQVLNESSAFRSNDPSECEIKRFVRSATKGSFARHVTSSPSSDDSYYMLSDSSSSSIYSSFSNPFGMCAR